MASFYMTSIANIICLQICIYNVFIFICLFTNHNYHYLSAFINQALSAECHAGEFRISYVALSMSLLIISCCFYISARITLSRPSELFIMSILTSKSGCTLCDITFLSGSLSTSAYTCGSVRDALPLASVKCTPLPLYFVSDTPFPMSSVLGMDASTLDKYIHALKQAESVNSITNLL